VGIFRPYKDKIPLCDRLDGIIDKVQGTSFCDDKKFIKGVGMDGRRLPKPGIPIQEPGFFIQKCMFHSVDRDMTHDDLSFYKNTSFSVTS